MSEKNGQLFILVEEKCQKCKGAGTLVNPLCAAKEYAEKEGIPFTLPRGTKKTIECPTCNGKKTLQTRRRLKDVFAEDEWREHVMGDVTSAIRDIRKLHSDLLNTSGEFKHSAQFAKAEESYTKLLTKFNDNLHRSLAAAEERLQEKCQIVIAELLSKQK